jgi:leucine dehydrogenase
MQRTKHVAGKPLDSGGTGDPLLLRLTGSFWDSRPVPKEAFGTDDLSGRKVAVQGIGHVGGYLVRHLTDSGAKVYVTDINADGLKSRT